jgi:hypothetical protein
MKNQINLHRDYDPNGIMDYFKSSVVQGVIIKLRFVRKRNRTLFEKIWIPARNKDIYFWLPYKNIVSGSDKYSIVGPESRFPYAKIWFEVKPECEIYKQGLNSFIFKQQLIREKAKEVCLLHPFLATELLTLSRKKVIKILDDFVFKKKTTTTTKK